MISSRVEVLIIYLGSFLKLVLFFFQACFFNIIKEAFRILFSSSYCLCDLFINEQPSEESGVEEMAP